jgi:hypothetical protein
MSFAMLLVGLALLGLLVAQIWMIVVAFKNGEQVWGILFIVSCFIPIGLFVTLGFMVTKWAIARRPSILFLSSIGVLILGVVVLASGAKQAMAEAMEQAEIAAAQARTVRVESPEPTEPAAPPRRTEPEPAPEPRRTPPPPKPAPATAVRSSSPADGTSAPGTLSPPPPVAESSAAPVTVELVSLGEASPNQMRTLQLRMLNPGKLAVGEVKLDLDYLDAGGRRMGGWTTIHSGTEVLAAAAATNDFLVPAFFVPQFTRDVRLKVRALRFDNGTRWPSDH